MKINKELTLTYNDVAINNKDIFFSAVDFNGLFRADINTGECNLIGVFPGEERYAYQLHRSAHKYCNKILFVPACGKQFVLYDIENESFQQVILLPDDIREIEYKYSASVLVGKYVYVFGNSILQILRIDMENLEIKYYDGWQEEFYKFGKKQGGLFFYRDVCIVENSLFVVTGQNNSIVELNMKLDEISIHPVGKLEDIYQTISYSEGYFLLTKSPHTIVKVNKKNWECSYEVIEGENWADFFSYSIMWDKELWLFPNSLNAILKVDCQKFFISEVELEIGSQDIWYPNTQHWGYGAVKRISENEIVLYCAQDCKMHRIVNGCETDSIKFFTRDNTEYFFERVIMRKWQCEDALSHLLGLIQYIDCKECSENNGQSRGEKIYRIIKKQVFGDEIVGKG